ncbi:MAG: glycoside hydrolase family 3 protein [Acidimicrobiia bacterium]|nr:glycoside hydrolase family 3 protein [Acidimicrobiia bacterium]
MKSNSVRTVQAAVVAVALLAAACSTTAPETTDEASGDGEAAAAPATTATEVDIEPPPDPGVVVDEALAALTVEEKVGQLLMPVLAGSSADEVDPADAALNRQISGLERPADIVDAFHLGGVLYLENNIESAEQLGRLSSGLQAAARTTGGPELLIAVDQEGGRVNRITDQVTVFPAASDLAGNIDAVTEASYVTGQQLQRQGINVVLAPVADVVLPGLPGFIGDRSFGDDPQMVADMVSGSIVGLQQSGVAAAVKHWPGHGATSTDSHLSLPELDVDRRQWDKRERVPFDAAIDHDVAIVVVGHLAVPGLDGSGTPATLSSVIIDDLLRRELGFDGVVMTDALNMGAVGQFDAGRISVDAIMAGADVLLVPPDLAASYEALLAAATDGSLSADRLDRSVRRVLMLKYKLGLLPGQGDG